MVEEIKSEICFAPWKVPDLYPNGRIDFCGCFVKTFNIKEYITNDYVDRDEILNFPKYMIIRNRMMYDDYQGCLLCCSMNNCKMEYDQCMNIAMIEKIYRNNIKTNHFS